MAVKEPQFVLTERETHWINSVYFLFLFSMMQIGLALLAKNFSAIATIHALLVVGIGVYISLTSHSAKNIAFVVAYLIGAELFWRMTNANVFWEFGKYASALVIGIGLLRFKKWKNAWPPILYLGCLLVSIPATISWFGWGRDAREAISFNFSGPFLLALSVIFFSQLKMNLSQLKIIAWLISLPIISVFTLAFYSTITAQRIVFTTESNFTTSGGFGPNQVSAVLGLGAVMMFLIFVFEKNRQMRVLALLFFSLFLIQSMLTFSRGGIYNAAICIFFAVIHIIRNKRARLRFFILALGLLLFFVYVVLPRLDDFTNGLFAQRFTDTGLTHRGDIALGELMVWRDYPIFGTGPGISKYEAFRYTRILAAAHTEYTRMLSEHGAFGFLALIILGVISVRAYIKAPNWVYKTWVVVFLMWPMTEMAHAAMRIAAISVLFGMSQISWGQEYRLISANEK